MDAPENWFREWFDSPYYHKLYIERDTDEAAGFIELLVKHLHPAAGSLMLDVACGRGRHACILADDSYDVTGIDLSPQSIAYALQFENDHLHFYEHDMRRLFWINYFDYAFNFFTSFGYFKTARENDDTMRTISQSLKKTGTFVLDYLNIHFAEKNLVRESTKQVGDIKFHLIRWADKTHLFKKIVIEDRNLEQPLAFTERVQRFSLDDFKTLFSRHQLTVTETFGDYQLNAFSEEESPRLILVACRS